MLESIRSFFRTSMPAPGDDKANPKDLRLAACALLLELAHADDRFSTEERGHLEGAIRRQFGLDEAAAAKLLDLAEQARSEAVDLWQFTNLIAESYSIGQKMVLAEIMWGLVYSDGKLASKEDYLMRKISNLLRLEPGYLAEARKRAEDAELGPGRFDVPD
ncbi:MAG: TerB family tellurite resistance protein [Gemmatimonadetes bacterium]|nr:TerB family tellurite resistance protein [Gemmatimonadota bacterium]